MNVKHAYVIVPQGGSLEEVMQVATQLGVDQVRDGRGNASDPQIILERTEPGEYEYVSLSPVTRADLLDEYYEEDPVVQALFSEEDRVVLAASSSHPLSEQPMFRQLLLSMDEEHPGVLVRDWRGTMITVGKFLALDEDATGE